MRLASFNVENLFARARALDPASPDSTRMLAAFERFNRLAQQPVYTDADKAAMISDLLTLGVAVTAADGRVVLSRNPASAMAVLRENRGDLLVVRTATGMEIVAAGRADWIGWLELVVEPVDEVAVRMTAKVIDTLAPDVLAVIEAEARPALVDFNTAMLSDRFRHVMLVEYLLNLRKPAVRAFHEEDGVAVKISVDLQLLVQSLIDVRYMQWHRFAGE